MACAAVVAALGACVLAANLWWVGNGGLAAAVSSNGSTPHWISRDIDRRINTYSAATLVARGAGTLARVDWSGMILTKQAREYEFRIVSDAPARLWIDGRLVVETHGSGDPPSEKVRLDSREHVIAIAYGPATRCAAFEVQWNGSNPYRLAAIPLEVFSPRHIPNWKWTVRGVMPIVGAAICMLWSVLIVFILSVLVWRRARVEWTPQLVAAVMGLAVVFVAGIWWGADWALDEIPPGWVVAAVDARFANGWYSKYPPMHHYLIGLILSPTIIMDRIHAVMLRPESIPYLMTVEERLLSVAMALVALVGIARLATTTLDRRHAWPAVVCAGLFLPFPYYAKTGNPDLPYVCWFVWSLVFFLDLYRNGRVRTATAFAITAAAAIATKDQAYGLYVLPAVFLIWRFGRSAAGWKILLAGAAAGLAMLAVCFNLVFNYTGFREHLALITGDASVGYRMFPATWGGQWLLAVTSAGQLLGMLGVAGLALILLSIGSHQYRRAQTAFALMLLFLLSYGVTFLAVVGYVYDRFLLPITTVLALSAAIGLRRLLDASSRRRAAHIAAALLMLWMAGRAAAIDALMIGDSRFAAERWLEAHVGWNDTVASAQYPWYLPQLEEFRNTISSPDRETTLATTPEFIVINREVIVRFEADRPERQWLAWLESGAAPYREVFRYKRNPWWSPLRWDRRFSDRKEDPFTNLDKINPEIVIFRRGAPERSTDGR